MAHIQSAVAALAELIVDTESEVALVEILDREVAWSDIGFAAVAVAAPVSGFEAEADYDMLMGLKVAVAGRIDSGLFVAKDIGCTEWLACWIWSRTERKKTRSFGVAVGEVDVAVVGRMMAQVGVRCQSNSSLYRRSRE